jgi:predicted acetyltransferase
MRVEVEGAAKSEKATLHNLLQLYLHDMSEFAPGTVDADGLFHYKFFDAYWTESERYPFFIRVDDSPAGFALIRRDQDGRADVSEFFVMRGYRRRGVGSMAAKRLFDLFPGDWQVRQESANTGAQRFWREAISQYTGGDFEDLVLDDGRWRGPAQRFHSSGAPHSAKEA